MPLKMYNYMFWDFSGDKLFGDCYSNYKTKYLFQGAGV